MIDENGIRLDGRGVNDLRPIRMEVSVLSQANGSSFVQWGSNKVYAAVYGPREVKPRHLQDMTKATLRCFYNMAPFSVDDRKRPGPDRRSVEISKVTTEAIASVVLSENFPNSMIDVFVEVVQADAGTRCTGIVAASLALADAGIPMTDMVTACTGGKINGQLVLDLAKEEDNRGDCDLPLALSPRKNNVTLLQMDGNLTREEFETLYDMVAEGAMKVYEMQKETMINKYKNE